MAVAVMSRGFDEAYAFTFSAVVEGGVSNDPNDRGGLTNNGFTQGLYDAWRSSKKLPLQSVLLITDVEKVAIAREEFWEPCKCEAMPSPLGAAVFDMAINSGAWNAKITLQRALGVKPDGAIGELTLLAAHSAPDALLRFLKRRGAFYQEDVRDHPAQVEFLGGWINRLLDLQDQAQKGAFA